MYSIFKMYETENELQQIISSQRAAMDEETVNGIMSTDAFSMERLEAYSLGEKVEQEQLEKMHAYQTRQQDYRREIQALEPNKNTPDGAIDYHFKMIEAEKNMMEMLLMKAAVLGRENVARQIRAKSLQKITFHRMAILEHCVPQSMLGVFQQRELEAEQTQYTNVMAEFNLRVLATAALGKVKAERKGRERDAENPVALMQKFLDADFSERTLDAGYVIEKLDTCLCNIEMIRHLSRIVFTGDTAAQVMRKLEAVGEYPNVVESALWEFGLTIDYDALELKGIDQNDEEFARRRQSYLDHGVIGFYLDARRYNQDEGNGEADDDANQQEARRTRVGDKLRVLEAELGIPVFKEESMRIARFHMRNVGKVGQAEAKDVIRASEREAQGKMEHLLIKKRFYQIYLRCKEKLREEIKSSAEPFERLQSFVEAYVSTNRIIFEDRAKAEEDEGNMLRRLKGALAGVQKSVIGECGKYAAILLGFLTDESSGYLEVPPGEINVIQDENIVLEERKSSDEEATRKYKDCTNMPLFAHRPNIKDIAQGNLGDCYLLAGLISVVNQDPEEIMNIMRDNGDGTVTVRFQREKTDEFGNTVYIPCYTTVRKTIPIDIIDEGDAFSRGALWVKMMEKAYTASGIHIIDSINAAMVENEYRQITYDILKAYIEAGVYGVDYNDISGGFTGQFISLLLGKKGNVYSLDKNRAEHVGNRIGRMLPAVNESRWKKYDARKFGNDSVDSIVYEYIKKQDEQQARRFLSLEKIETENRKDNKALTSYRGDKEALQKYRRTCILILDIADSLAQGFGVDILMLDTKEKVQTWYSMLKVIFFKYKTREELNPPSKVDEMIEGVWNNYLTDDFQTSFDNIRIDQFNTTIDILERRHLELLRRNQEGGQGVGAGAQEQDQLYSARDLKLFERIEDALKSDYYIVFDTRVLSQNHTGKNGESVVGGMVGTHAYMIINTRRIEVNGEECLFFVVMNPWAEKGVVYDVGKNAGEIRERAVQGEKDNEKEEGVFCLELSRFAEVALRWETV